MRLHLFAYLFLLFPFFAHAQSAEALIAASDAIYSANPDSSLTLSLKAIEQAKATHDTVMLARAQAKCARYYLLKSDFEQTGVLLNTAIDLQEKTGDKKGLAYSYKLKAILQKRIGNSSDALQLQQDAVTLYRDAGDYDGMCSVLLNLSLDFIEANDFARAGAALDTIAAHPEYNSGASRYFYLQNRGTLHAAQGEYESAIALYDSAKVVALKYELVDSYVTLLALIAAAEIKTGDLAAAEIALLESCSLARKNNLDHELNEALIQLTQLYVAKGDFFRAYQTEQEQTALSTKLYNIERVNKINELEKRLELAEKEKEIARKDIDIAVEKSKQESLQRQNLFLSLAIAGLVLVAVLIALLLVRTRNLNKQIAGQSKLIAEKSELVENAYTKITDSISYSKRIQRAMLPTPETIADLFPESFVIYSPKDIVSGDFYWFEKRSGKILFAVADCTGHGVPGAFLSIVGYNYLHQAVNIHQLDSPEKILDHLAQGVSFTLKQNDDDVANDGMDVSVCSFDPQTHTLLFAGANHPAWIVREGVLFELRGDNQPIGAYPGQELRPFILQEFQLKKNDMLYLFSDGYPDQFGGTKGAKLKHRSFKHLLLECEKLSAAEQKKYLHEALKKWQGEYEQVDDVLVLGVRIA